MVVPPRRYRDPPCEVSRYLVGVVTTPPPYACRSATGASGSTYRDVAMPLAGDGERRAEDARDGDEVSRCLGGGALLPPLRPGTHSRYVAKIGHVTARDHAYLARTSGDQTLGSHDVRAAAEQTKPSAAVAAVSARVSGLASS